MGSHSASELTYLTEKTVHDVLESMHSEMSKRLKD